MRLESRSPWQPLFWLLPIGVVLYFPTLKGTFVSEDLICVWTWGFAEVLDELLSPGVDVGYRPISVLFWAIQRLLFGEQAFAYHLVAALLHAGNAFLVFLLVRRLFSQPSVSWVAALLFLSAPVHTETLMWLAAMANTATCSFFLLAAAVLYLRWLDDPLGSSRWPSMGLFLLALFTKELAVCLVFILPLLDLRLGHLKIEGWRGDAAELLRSIEKIGVAMVRRHLPYWLILGIYAVSYFVANQGVLAYGSEHHLRVGAFWLDHLTSYLHWLAMPWSEWLPLSLVDSVLQGHRLIWLPLLLGASLISRELRWSLAWVLATLAPVISIPAARHHAYLAAAGSALLLAWLISGIGQRFGPRLVWIFAGILIAVNAWTLHREAGPWVEAGRVTQNIPQATRDLLPNPAPKTRFFFLGIPDTVQGAYAFRWGLNEAVQRAYRDRALEAYKISERPLFPNEIGVWTIDRSVGPSVFLSYESGKVRLLEDSEVKSLFAETPLIEHDRSEVAVGEIHGDIKVGQTVVSPADASISRIDLLFGTYKRPNRHPVIFHLQRGSASGEEVATVTIPPSTLEDNHWHSIRFPAVEARAGESFYFWLESPDSESGDAVTLWASAVDSYPGGGLLKDGKPTLGDLRFRIFHRGS